MLTITKETRKGQVSGARFFCADAVDPDDDSVAECDGPACKSAGKVTGGGPRSLLTITKETRNDQVIGAKFFYADAVDSDDDSVAECDAHTCNSTGPDSGGGPWWAC